MFGLCFYKIFLGIIFENINNIILVFSKIRFYSCSFEFGIFLCFSKKKIESNMFSVFTLFSLIF